MAADCQLYIVTEQVDDLIMKFIETRGNDGKHPETGSFSTAMLNPLTSFGGLYSPEKLPEIEPDFLQSHINSDYKTLAASLLTLFDIDIKPSTIAKAVGLYDKFDDPTQPCLLYTSPSPRDRTRARMPSSA